MNFRGLSSWCGCCLLAAAFCGGGLSATLSMKNQTLGVGQTTIAPILLATGGDSVAAVQFDLQWDENLSIKIAAGAALRSSFKVLYTATPAAGTLRCLIVGDNLAAIADGAIAQVFITANRVSSGAPVTITNIVASDSAGNAVPLQANGANISIQNGVVQTLAAGSILNSASLQSGPIAPGEIVTLIGSFPLAPSVLMNGIRSPVIYAGSKQINAIVPFGLDLSGPADVQIRSENRIVARGSLAVQAAAPAIFTQESGGTGAGAILNQDFSLNTSAAPARRDSIVVIYGTGFGPMQSAIRDGQVMNKAISLAGNVTATIGGVPAEVVYAGAAPDEIAGVTQINVRVPHNVAADPFSPIVLKIGGVNTPPGVTIAVHE